jgi:FtsH-binding integral membrane protein
MVNDIYGLHFFLCSATCFTTVLTTLLRIYIGVVNKESLFMIIHANILWILYVAQFGLMCWICTLAREESQRTGTFIYAFVLKCKNLYLNCVRNEVNDFAVQLQHRVAFTACNFFEIHNVLFTGVSVNI